MSLSLSLWSLVAQSDFFTKALVALLLFCTLFSIVYSLYAYLTIKFKFKELEGAVQEIIKNKVSFDVYCQNNSQNIITFFIKEAKEMKKMSYDKAAIQEALSSNAQEYFSREIAIIKLLGAAASASPLLGLLGTVWGIINAFLGMAQSQGVDLAAIAPGIAEALITTLAGLFVAIPALIFYHILSLLISKCDVLINHIVFVIINGNNNDN